MTAFEPTTPPSPSTHNGKRGRLAVALVHYPVLDKFGGVQTTALTNLDVHDIARSSRTFGCAAYYIVTPIHAQVEQARAITGYWEGERGSSKNPDRASAMSRVQITLDVDGAIAAETEAAGGKRPLIVVTSARPQGTVPYTHLRQRLDDGEHALVLFGTGHGLADSVHGLADLVLAPIVGPADDDGTFWNHLSVRSAAAIILDRLCGS